MEPLSGEFEEKRIQKGTGYGIDLTASVKAVG